MYIKIFLSIFYICYFVCKRDYVRKKLKYKDENVYDDNVYNFVVVDCYKLVFIGIIFVFFIY